ncbi:MAG TPA: zf-HC2 domain-containing protein [Nitrospirota bacterium]|nr:zf-HC2 domain-containing protein [Nitrospirota bacterium]
MSCPQYLLISAYIDDELQRADKTAFEAHLPGCSQCGAALAEMRSLRTAFANVERHQASYGFAARVMARTAALRKEKIPWVVPRSIRFAEAAILLIVITVGILAGKVITKSSLAVKSTNIALSLSLDMFDATPPGSLGKAYLAMTEVRNEK